MIRQLKLETPRVRELHDLRTLRGNWRKRLKAVLGGKRAGSTPRCGPRELIYTFAASALAAEADVPKNGLNESTNLNP